MSALGRRQQLRESTAGAHHRLDSQVARLDLSRLEDYRRFLQANGSAVIAVEALLDRAHVDALCPDWPARKRGVNVRADLTGLGIEPLTMTWAHELPKPAELFGMLYVLEGSRLGGRFLLPRVQASIDERVRANVRFLSPQSPAMWSGFLDLLESSAAAADVDGLITGAHDTFALFEQSFSLVLAD
jgi:heme oxygenase